MKAMGLKNLIEEADACDREWAVAKIICEELLAEHSPPMGVVGRCRSISSCMMGLVSARCGGNPVAC